MQALQDVLVELHGIRAAFAHNGGRVGPAEMSRLVNLLSEVCAWACHQGFAASGLAMHWQLLTMHHTAWLAALPLFQIAELRQRVVHDCGSNHVVAVQLGTLLVDLQSWHGSTQHLEQGSMPPQQLAPAAGLQGMHDAAGGMLRHGSSSSGGHAQTDAAAMPARRRSSTESQPALVDDELECGVPSAQSSISFVLRIAPSAAAAAAAGTSSAAGCRNSSNGEGGWSSSGSSLSSLGGSRDSSRQGG
jgi:hypothetical protein